MRDTPDPTTADIATYIAETCVELRRLAPSPQFRIVNYLLNMAQLEAERMSKEEDRKKREKRR